MLYMTALATLGIGVVYVVTAQRRQTAELCAFVNQAIAAPAPTSDRGRQILSSYIKLGKDLGCV